MINDLQASVLTTENKISDLKAENGRLSQEQAHLDYPNFGQLKVRKRSCLVNVKRKSR